jgi:hypothetical protein
MYYMQNTIYKPTSVWDYMGSGVQVIISSQNKITTYITMFVASAVFGLSSPFTISTFNVKQCAKYTMKLIFWNTFYFNLIFLNMAKVLQNLI